MENIIRKPETRIIPEETSRKFYAQHLKPYEFLKNETTGKKILEVGCGDGYGSAYLAEAANKVIGIDYEQEVIAQAKNKYCLPNLSFTYMDATNLEFKDATFDIICSFQVIEHIPEDKLLNYLFEIKRVLKRGGKFYVSTLNLNHTMKSPLSYKKNAAHCKEFTFEELKILIDGGQLDESGFRFFIGYSGWGVGQLENEINENSWIVTKALSADELLQTDSEVLWKQVLKAMGGKYEMFSNYPTDPRLN